ncbi:MAG: transposase [Actinoallomurus sp.]|nr:transposase [Actinoallomurus sp.]
MRYVRGLLSEGRRKSMEPMAARLGADRQGLQQLLTDSPWSHQLVLAEIAWRMEAVIGPDAWVVDDVSLPKDGHHSPGVAPQYCGALGKTANCQVAPSVHLVTDEASCPVNWRLFVPESWDEMAVPRELAAEVAARRCRARIPDEVGHVPKWQLAVDMIDELCCWGLDAPLVVADEGYGQDGLFRLALDERCIPYVVGILPQPRPPPGWKQTRPAIETRPEPLPETVTTGVVPRRDQVRALGGLRIRPASSSKQTHPSRTAAALLPAARPPWPRW